METDERLRKIFSAIFNIPSNEIDDSASPDTIEQWDSVQHLQLVMAVEGEFSIQFDADNIAELTSFASFLKHVQTLM